MTNERSKAGFYRLLAATLFACVVLFVGFSARAEYRAFRLAIVDSAGGNLRTVITTLDPGQYREYHAMKPTETAAIEATWMCYARSENFKPICAQPGDAGPTPGLPPSRDPLTIQEKSPEIPVRKPASASPVLK